MWILLAVLGLADEPPSPSEIAERQQVLDELDELDELVLVPSEGPPAEPRGPLSLSAQLGLALSPRGSTPGPLVHVDAAYRFPGSDVLDATVSVTGMRTAFRDGLADPQAQGGRLAYRLSESVAVLGLGVRLHAPYDPSALLPELTLAVGAALHRSTVTVDAGGGTTQASEWTLGPAARLVAGLSGTISGPIQLVGGIGGDLVPTHGELSGNSLLLNLHINLGLRVMP